MQQVFLDKLKINRVQQKCFIFDLDGTIIFNNQRLSPENEALLLKIKAAGHQLIFATGRPLREFKTVMPAWCHEQQLVLFSGGVSIHNDAIVRSHGVKTHLAEDIVALCMDKEYHFIMDNLSHYYHPDYKNAVLGIIDIQNRKYHISDLSQMLNTEIYKILIFNMEGHEFFTQYALEHDLLLKHHSYSCCFDLVSSKCNKYLGVLPFIQDFANDDIFVFGNDFNDFELFSHFTNSILFGDIAELKKLVKLNISYDLYLQQNFSKLINTILA